MKKILSLILLISLSLAFYSCGDDEDEPEKFVWNGDWNDPDDPNYKPEGYNPIQGLWRSDYDNRYGFYFSEDFKGYTVYFYPDGKYIKELMHKNNYQINDKAYRFSATTPWTYKYKTIEGKLYIASHISLDDYSAYSRVPEN